MKEFSTVICVSIIAYGIIEMMSPNSKFSKTFKRSLSVIIVFLIFLSLKNVIGAGIDIDMPDFSSKINTEQNSEEFTENLKEQTEKNIETQIIEFLENNNQPYKLIDAVVFSDSEGKINDYKVYVYIDRENYYSQKIKIQSLLKEEFNINVIVKDYV